MPFLLGQKATLKREARVRGFFFFFIFVEKRAAMHRACLLVMDGKMFKCSCKSQTQQTERHWSASTDSSSTLSPSINTDWMLCVQCAVIPRWLGHSLQERTHCTALKAIYLSRNDHSFSVDMMHLLSIRYFCVSKGASTNLVTIHWRPLEKTEPCWVLYLPNRLGRWKTGIASKGETVQECISHHADLTLMKLYWNVS